MPYIQRDYLYPDGTVSSANLTGDYSLETCEDILFNMVFAHTVEGIREAGYIEECREAYVHYDEFVVVYEIVD